MRDKDVSGQASDDSCCLRPSIEQVAWVMRHIRDHFREGGTFRYLIYDRMGFDGKAYHALYVAGGLEISNAAHDLRKLQNANHGADGRSTGAVS